MENMNFTKGDLLADEVNVDLDVLGPAVMSGVSCHVYVVIKDNRGGE